MYKLKIYSKPKPIKMKCSATFPPIILANLQEKEVIPTKEVQEIVADKTYDGLSKVTMQSIPNEYIVPSGEIKFTQNGTYDVTDKASAKVNIKEKVLGTKTITSNGTYKAIDDNLDGYSEVEVATSGVDINEYMSDTITKGTSISAGWIKTIIKLRSPLTIEGSDASYMFYGYPLNDIPQIDTSNVTNMAAMFYECSNLKTMLQINTSKVTDMSTMFRGCSKLIEIPLLDTINVTNMTSMFFECSSLTTIPQFNTSNVTNMSYMFRNCKNLSNIPLLDTSNVTNMNSMFYNFGETNKLTTIPQFNTSNVTNMSYMFYFNEKLSNIPLLDTSNVTNINSMFRGCDALTNFGGLANLGQAYLTTQNANYSNYKLDLSNTTKLTEQSIINVLTNLYDIATKGVKPQTVTLGSTNLAKLVSEEGQQALQTATERGWNIN